jgi:dihydroorotate dehydrogenase/Pyruvate/2-oxoacid:ferredoxin oxidoreductase delta subunit
MLDLSVNFAGLELKNPLMVASSDNVRDIRQIRKAEHCGASAVIIKALFPPGALGLKPKLRLFIDAKGLTRYGACVANRLTYDQGIELVKAAKKETKIKIGINIPFYSFDERERCAQVAERASDAGADFIELNFRGQTSDHIAGMQTLEEWEADQARGVERVREYASDLTAWISEGTRFVKQAVNIPVIAKIAPEGIDVVAVAKALERGGADAIDAINNMGGAFKVDIFNGGRPKLIAAKNSFLRCSGAPMKPYAQGFVARISKVVNIPVLGTGGLMNWTDAVEMMMFGATTVSFCTLLLIHGFEAITEIEKGLRGFMEQQGYGHVDDFRGLALKYVAPSEPACEVIPSVARIDKEKCTGCGICLKPAHCLATSIENGKAAVCEAECLGCGTCFQLCPAGAISMIEI